MCGRLPSDEQFHLLWLNTAPQAAITVPAASLTTGAKVSSLRSSRVCLCVRPADFRDFVVELFRLLISCESLEIALQRRKKIVFHSGINGITDQIMIFYSLLYNDHFAWPQSCLFQGPFYIRVLTLSGSRLRNTCNLLAQWQVKVNI